MSISTALPTTALPTPTLLHAPGPFSPLPCQLGIVAARYKEPLDPWADFAKNTYLYSKGGIPAENDSVPHDSFRLYKELPNIGREGHTHLWHIVHNYDKLDDIMIFTQADPFDLVAPAANTSADMVSIALTVERDEATPFNDDLWHDVDDWEKINWTDPKQAIWITPSQLASMQPAPYTPAGFWNIILRGRYPRRDGFWGPPHHPNAIRAMHGGTFAVRRETIRSQPRKAWLRALREFEIANATNPEQGFFMERFWSGLFSRRYWLDKVEDP
ncbi:hypothetical protein F4779DRAFT_583556 [Xylariaceae sp. FL0662B]|nr:hypothetical protein F4779DRAFT_583556 [Xylariaceae sp. FL0662B]